MSLGRDEEPEQYLRALATGLGKCGIPVQIRSDSDKLPYVRASHPTVPLSTDVYCVREENGSWGFRSEWGSVIAPAEDAVSAIEYVVTLLRPPP
jgi:hypothetical protein